MLEEWVSFRQTTITRRSQHRLQKVLDRIHILEGRQLVLLNIDEVIAIIRQSDEPKAALIERFRLSATGRPRTSWRSACASWRGWKPSRSNRSCPACAKSRASWRTSWAARPACGA
jgi:hypothetical protein